MVPAGGEVLLEAARKILLAERNVFLFEESLTILWLSKVIIDDTD